MSEAKDLLAAGGDAVNSASADESRADPAVPRLGGINPSPLVQLLDAGTISGGDTQDGWLRNPLQRRVLLLCGLNALLGFLWMACSGRLPGLFAADPATVDRLRVSIDWVFVAGANIALYAILRWQMHQWSSEAEARERAETGMRFMGALMETIQDTVFVTDLRTGKRSVNAAACREHGYTGEELCNLPLAKLSTLLKPDYDWRKHVANIRAAGGSKFFETRHFRKDGSSFPVEASANYVRYGGRDYSIAVCRDISERLRDREALQRNSTLLQAVADHTPDLVVVKDSEGRYLYVNEAGARVAGRPVAEILGKDDAAIYDAETACRIVERDRRAKLACRPTSDEVTLAGADGMARTYLSNKVPYLDEQGKMMGLIDISSDITERIKIEEGLREIAEQNAANAAMRKMNQELERRVQERTRALESANKDLEFFARSVAHDLRAPLQYLQGYLGLLQRRAESEMTAEARKYLKTIGGVGTGMAQLINDLLTFSRVASMDIGEATVSLASLARDVIDEMGASLEGRRISWRVESLPPVIGHAALLKKVLANLIGNAVNFSRSRDPARITVGCSGVKEGHATLFVRDNGVGFDASRAPKLFTAFHRLHEAGELTGIGLGLATVQRIIARHGGEVWADAEIDRGATIYFTLRPASSRDTPIPIGVS